MTRVLDPATFYDDITVIAAWEKLRAVFRQVPPLFLPIDTTTAAPAAASVYPDGLSHLQIGGGSISGVNVAHEFGHCLQWAAQLARYPKDRVWSATNAVWTDPTNSIYVEYAKWRPVAGTIASHLTGDHANLIYEMFADTCARLVTGFALENEMSWPWPGDDATLAFFRGLFPVVTPTTVVVTPPPPVPTPPAPVAPPVTDYGAHWYSQWAPDHVGRGDCVPTSMKMLLSLYGMAVPTIADLRTRCDIDDDGVIDLGKDAGITLDAARKALADYGLVGTVVSSADVPLDDVLAHVAEGRPVIAFLLYADIPGRLDTGFGGLHAVVLVGDVVLDPDNSRDVPAHYPVADLQKAWADGKTIGGGAFIPDRAMGDSMNDADILAAVNREVGRILGDPAFTIQDTVKAIKAQETKEAVALRDAAATLTKEIQ